MVYFLTSLCCTILLAAMSYTSPTEIGSGICQCAVFKNVSNALKENPLVFRDTEVDMIVDDEGRNECTDLCVALADAARPTAPKVLCNAAIGDKDAASFTVTIYSRLHENENWISSGKSSPKPYCCKLGLPIKCPKNE